MAEMQKMTKDEALAKVAQGVGSIYSKEDVIGLINSIEAPESEAKITELTMDQIANEVASEFYSDGSNLIDDFEVDIHQGSYGSTSFEVELTSIELNECRIEEIVKTVLVHRIDIEEVEETVETD